MAGLGFRVWGTSWLKAGAEISTNATYFRILIRYAIYIYMYIYIYATPPKTYLLLGSHSLDSETECILHIYIIKHYNIIDLLEIRNLPTIP